MSGASALAHRREFVQTVPPPLKLALLLRLACAEGATRAEIVRDLAPLASHKLSPAAWRELADAEIAALIASGHASETRSRLQLSDAGRSAVESLFCARTPLPSSWPDMRDTRLVALALGLGAEPAARLKSLAKPDMLRAIVLQQAYGLPLKPKMTPSRMRAALAVVALERAFGNKIKSGLGAGAGLPAKTGRLLAAQLCERPREFGTDSRLVAALAAEKAGAVQSDADALRTALLRRWIETALHGPGLPATASQPGAVPVAAGPPAPANDRGLAPLAEPRPQRPDLKGFSAAVIAAARPHAEGWPGNRKTFISVVWDSIRTSHPQWGLTAIEFKCMLAEAHRCGLVTLANADIKDKRRMKELQDSAVVYKNTVWHFVRVED